MMRVYYLLEEPYSVGGFGESRGMLKEAALYNTYGEATIYARPIGSDRPRTTVAG